MICVASLIAQWTKNERVKCSNLLFGACVCSSCLGIATFISVCVLSHLGGFHIRNFVHTIVAYLQPLEATSCCGCTHKPLYSWTSVWQVKMRWIAGISLLQSPTLLWFMPEKPIKISFSCFLSKVEMCWRWLTVIKRFRAWKFTSLAVVSETKYHDPDDEWLSNLSH